WQDLPPLPGAVRFLDELWRWASHENWQGAGTVELYFLTKREGRRCKDQTEMWLQSHGYVGRPPTVCIVRGSKGPLAQSLGLDSVVDDRPENLIDVKRHRPACQTILVKAPYNTWAHEGPDRADVLVDS